VPGFHPPPALWTPLWRLLVLIAVFIYVQLYYSILGSSCQLQPRQFQGLSMKQLSSPPPLAAPSRGGGGEELGAVAAGEACRHSPQHRHTPCPHGWKGVGAPGFPGTGKGVSNCCRNSDNPWREFGCPPT